MFFVLILFVCLGAAVVFGILSGLSDVRGLEIPNAYSVIVLASFFVAYGVLWAGGLNDDVFAPFWSHLGAGLVMFAISFTLFSLGILGAGDSKLGSAYAFWVGLNGLTVFLFTMALVGAVLGVIALIYKKWRLWPGASEKSWIGRVQNGESAVPYGVAIAFGAIVSFVELGYLEVFTF